MPNEPHHPLPERDDARNDEVPEHIRREKGFQDAPDRKPAPTPGRRPRPDGVSNPA